MSQPPSLSSSGLPEVTSDDKMFAMIAHLSIFVFPVIGPLIVYVIKKDSSPFAAYHALQSLVFQLIVWFGSSILITVLSIITLGFCGWIGCLAYLGIFAAIPFGIKANNGEWAGYPLIDKIGRPPGV